MNRGSPQKYDGDPSLPQKPQISFLPPPETIFEWFPFRPRSFIFIFDEGQTNFYGNRSRVPTFLSCSPISSLVSFQPTFAKFSFQPTFVCISRVISRSFQSVIRLVIINHGARGIRAPVC